MTNHSKADIAVMNTIDLFEQVYNNQEQMEQSVQESETELASAIDTLVQKIRDIKHAQLIKSPEIASDSTTDDMIELCLKVKSDVKKKIRAQQVKRSKQMQQTNEYMKQLLDHIEQLTPHSRALVKPQKSDSYYLQKKSKDALELKALKKMLKYFNSQLHQSIINRDRSDKQTKIRKDIQSLEWEIEKLEEKVRGQNKGTNKSQQDIRDHSSSPVPNTRRQLQFEDDMFSPLKLNVPKQELNNLNFTLDQEFSLLDMEMFNKLNAVDHEDVKSTTSSPLTTRDVLGSESPLSKTSPYETLTSNWSNSFETTPIKADTSPNSERPHGQILTETIELKKAQPKEVVRRRHGCSDQPPNHLNLKSSWALRVDSKISDQTAQKRKELLKAAEQKRTKQQSTLTPTPKKLFSPIPRQGLTPKRPQSAVHKNIANVGETSFQCEAKILANLNSVI